MFRHIREIFGLLWDLAGFTLALILIFGGGVFILGFMLWLSASSRSTRPERPAELREPAVLASETSARLEVARRTIAEIDATRQNYANRLVREGVDPGEARRRAWEYREENRAAARATIREITGQEVLETEIEIEPPPSEPAPVPAEPVSVPRAQSKIRMGQALERTNPRAARQHYEDVIREFPDSLEAATARARLSALGG